MRHDPLTRNLVKDSAQSCYMQTIPGDPKTINHVPRVYFPAWNANDFTRTNWVCKSTWNLLMWILNNLSLLRAQENDSFNGTDSSSACECEGMDVSAWKTTQTTHRRSLEKMQHTFWRNHVGLRKDYNTIYLEKHYITLWWRHVGFLNF